MRTTMVNEIGVFYKIHQFKAVYGLCFICGMDYVLPRALLITNRTPRMDDENRSTSVRADL
jgi:hypothetical protein